MTRLRWAWAVAVLASALGANSARGDGGPFDGEWRTTIGLVKLKQVGPDVAGSYGNAGQFTIQGKVEGKVFKYDFSEGQATGTARWTLADPPFAFEGNFQVKNGRAGAWNGWRPDPSATTAPEGKFAGLWLTSLGLMELTQDAGKVQGRFALRGNSTLEGSVQGRELDFRYQVFHGGKGYFDRAADGKGLPGAAQDDGFSGYFAWTGRPAPEFVRHVPLRAGEILDGSTKGLLTYAVRAPEGYPGPSGKTWPAVVILHGSNMNGRDYVATIATAWPDVARDFLLIGINGERPSSIGPDPRFNYNYVNAMGRSIHGGFPGTDRDSPALVAEALAELKGIYPISRTLVGGHSQGGFMTYWLMMNNPELVAGAFPISGGLLFQCTPESFSDEALKKAQVRVPLAIVHGKNDPVVDPSLGRSAAEEFLAASWPAVRFFNPDQGGHMFALLPVNRAIRWLDDLASGDADRLLAAADERFQAKAYRDATSAIRFYELRRGPNQRFDPRIAKVRDAVHAVAQPRGDAVLARLKEGKPGWIDAVLDFLAEFEQDSSAADVSAGLFLLRAEQQKPAQAAFDAANAAFQQGKNDDGYKKYQEIMDKYPASTHYRAAKRALSRRR